MGCDTCDVDLFFVDFCLSCVDDNFAGILLEFFIFAIAIAGLATASDHLCNSLETLCDRWNVPEDVGGATFMAFGSAVPEITVNAVAAIRSVTQDKRKHGGSVADLGVGAIMGSGLIAFLVIPACCAFGTPISEELKLDVKPMLRDTFTYSVALAVLVSSIFLKVDSTKSLVLILIYVGFIIGLVGLPFKSFFRRLIYGEPQAREPLQRQPSRFRESVQRRSQQENSVQGAPPASSQSGTYFQLSGESAEGTNIQPVKEESNSSSSSNGAGQLGAILHANPQDETTGDGPGSLEQPLNNDSPPPHGINVFAKCWRATMKVIGLIFLPVQRMIDATCPDCRLIEGTHENLYPVTFFASFVWMALFSFITTVVVERFVELLERPETMSFFGLVLVAVGAEIPDTVNAVTVARRGYGSMATSSCIGSQVCNICLGLGLPWTILSFSGFDISLGDREGRSYLWHIALLVSLAVFTNLCVLPAAGVAESMEGESLDSPLCDHHRQKIMVLDGSQINASNGYDSFLTIYGWLNPSGQNLNDQFQLVPDPPIDGGSTNPSTYGMNIFPKRLVLPPMGSEGSTSSIDAVLNNSIPLPPLFPYVSNHGAAVPTEYASMESHTTSTDPMGHVHHHMMTSNSHNGHSQVTHAYVDPNGNVVMTKSSPDDVALDYSAQDMPGQVPNVVVIDAAQQNKVHHDVNNPQMIGGPYGNPLENSDDPIDKMTDRMESVFGFLGVLCAAACGVACTIFAIGPACLEPRPRREASATPQEEHTAATSLKQEESKVTTDATVQSATSSSQPSTQLTKDSAAASSSNEPILKSQASGFSSKMDDDVAEGDSSRPEETKMSPESSLDE